MPLQQRQHTAEAGQSSTNPGPKLLSIPLPSASHTSTAPVAPPSAEPISRNGNAMAHSVPARSCWAEEHTYSVPEPDVTILVTSCHQHGALRGVDGHGAHTAAHHLPDAILTQQHAAQGSLVPAHTATSAAAGRSRAHTRLCVTPHYLFMSHVGFSVSLLFI